MDTSKKYIKMCRKKVKADLKAIKKGGIPL